jgi:hypothetical protein
MDACVPSMGREEDVGLGSEAMVVHRVRKKREEQRLDVCKGRQLVGFIKRQ